MSDKFEYAPGRPGFGTRGDDGSMGLPGLAIYFTDFDTTTDAATIQTLIANNTVLWSQLNEPLPGGRVYNTGDLFADLEGKIYEINAETNTYVYKFASLNVAGYFTDSEVDTDNGFNRFFNNNLTPKYIIDNVYADGDIIYHATPSDIYNILTKNYARIEYSNVELNGYNPFTVYSSGLTTPADDAKSLALVRQIDNNTFRLGNLDSDGNLRNVNLIFDVSSLKVNKTDSGARFKTSTPAGTILTNYEIDANALFSGNFFADPSSFRATSSQSSITISWNKGHFTPDPDVIADLYFYRDAPVASQVISYNDVSTYRPLVMYNCTTTGVVNIQNLTELTAYKYYMNFSKNGWSRRSVVRSTATTPVPNISVIPLSSTEASTAHTMGFCVSSNVEWSSAFVSNPGSFLSNLTPLTGGAYGIPDACLNVTMTANTADDPRSGTIRVFPSNGSNTSVKVATVVQRGAAEPVIVDVSAGATSRSTNNDSWDLYQTRAYTVDISTLYQNNTIDISVYWMSQAYTTGSVGSMNVVFTNRMDVQAPGKTTVSGSFNTTLPAGQIQEQTGVISLRDVSISNLPLTITSIIDANAESGSDVVAFGTSMSITQVLIKYRTGTRVAGIYNPIVNGTITDYVYWTNPYNPNPLDPDGPAGDQGDMQLSQ